MYQFQADVKDLTWLRCSHNNYNFKGYLCQPLSSETRGLYAVKNIPRNAHISTTDREAVELRRGSI